MLIIFGPHIYRFVSAGLASNNLSIMVDSGSYPTSFSLTGKVLDQNGQGMPGVKVTVSNSDGGKFSTTTGSAGFYAIDVATGVYLVNAEFPGYVFTQTSVQATTGISYRQQDRLLEHRWVVLLLRSGRDGKFSYLITIF